MDSVSCSVSAISVESAVGNCQRALVVVVVVDATADAKLLVARRVAADSAVTDRRRSLVEDATAGVRSVITGDRAGGDLHGSTVVDASAPAVRLVVAHGAVAHRQRTRVKDAARVSAKERGNVAGSPYEITGDNAVADYQCAVAVNTSAATGRGKGAPAYFQGVAGDHAVNDRPGRVAPIITDAASIIATYGGIPEG